MTVRTMWDGIGSDAATISRLARPGDLVLYYVDGPRSVWSTAERALIPAGVEHVTCTVTGGAADVADCEPGDMAAGHLEAWITARKGAGYARPTVYTSLDNVPAVRQGTGKWVLGKDYDLIVADYDNIPASVYPGSAGTQYKSTASYDVTAVFDDAWPRRTPAPAPKPAGPPRPPSADLWPAGTVLREGSKGAAVYALQYALRDSGLRLSTLVPDGAFGPQTLIAVRAAQQDMHLNVDGIAGPATRAAMIAHGYLTPQGEGR